MSEIAKKIDRIIKNNLAPGLKLQGFRKNARNFYREHDNRIDVINIQASKWNEGDCGQFTVNIGVYFPSIANITDDTLVKGLPKEYECTIRSRIGQLTEQNKDFWWSINSSANEAVISSDLASKVESCCLPWLDKMSNLENVKNSLVKSNMAFVASGIALYQGNKEEAALYLEQSLIQTPYAQFKIKEWGKKHGLLSE